MKNTWLISPYFDLAGLFLPVWLCWGILLCLPAETLQMDVPLWVWVVFILGIDVSHVWSTLYRTYANKEEFAFHRVFLSAMPLVLFVGSFTLLWFSELWFWRVMAYIAVFHFIRQQYGFTALYRIKEKRRKQTIGDKHIIYIATLYPVIFWHLTTGRQFDWFVQGDFFPIAAWLQSIQPVLQPILTGCNGMYWLLIGAWLLQEINAYRKDKTAVSPGKLLWVITTAWTWYGGIVAFNSDVVFTVSNVVAHGVPYVLLMWHYRRKKEALQQQAIDTTGRKLKWTLVLLGSILSLAIAEEYLWDMLVWQEHRAFFEAFLPYIAEPLSSHAAYSAGVALLALPQLLHYFIDGVIWKMNARNPHMKTVFIPSDEKA